MNLKEFRGSKLFRQLVTDDKFAGGTEGWWDVLAGFVAYFLVYEEWVNKENLAYPGPTKGEILKAATSDLPEPLAEEIRSGMSRYLSNVLSWSGGYGDSTWLYTWGGKLLPTQRAVEDIEETLREQGLEPFAPGVVTSDFVSEVEKILKWIGEKPWGPPTSLHDLWWPWLCFGVKQGTEEERRRHEREVEYRQRLFEEEAA